MAVPETIPCDEAIVYGYLWGRYSVMHDLTGTTGLFDERTMQHIVAIRELQLESVKERFPDLTDEQLVMRLTTDLDRGAPDDDNPDGPSDT